MFTSKSLGNRLASLILLFSLVCSGFQPASASAAQGGGDGLKRQVNAETGKVSFIGPESGRALLAAKALSRFLRPQDPGWSLIKRFAPGRSATISSEVDDEVKLCNQFRAVGGV